MSLLMFKGRALTTELTASSMHIAEASCWLKIREIHLRCSTWAAPMSISLRLLFWDIQIP